ncbi:MAG: hypothetical protein ACPGRF_01530, partial [Miltoncostaeaceae bacterium]
MGALVSLARRVNTFARDTRTQHETSLEGGTITVLPGDPMLAGAIADLVGAPVAERPGADLVVIPLGPHDDSRAAAREVRGEAQPDHEHQHPRGQEPQAVQADLVALLGAVP